jgi:hypothetical protein
MLSFVAPELVAPARSTPFRIALLLPVINEKHFTEWHYGARDTFLPLAGESGVRVCPYSTGGSSASCDGHRMSPEEAIPGCSVTYQL